MKITKKQTLFTLLALLIAVGAIILAPALQSQKGSKQTVRPKEATTKQIAATPTEYAGKTVSVKGFIVETEKNEYSILNQGGGSKNGNLIDLDLSAIKDKDKYLPKNAVVDKDGKVVKKVVTVTGSLDRHLVLKAETISEE